MVAVGALAIEGIARIRADLLFLGVTGVHAEEGLTTGDIEEAAIKRALIGRAAETVVLATIEKLGAVSPCLVAPLEDVTALIVVKDTPETVTAPLAARGLAVVRA